MNDLTPSQGSTAGADDIINLRIDKKRALNWGFIAFFVAAMLFMVFLLRSLSLLTPRAVEGVLVFQQVSTLVVCILMFAGSIGGFMAMLFTSETAVREGFMARSGRCAAERAGALVGVIFGFAAAACVQGVVHPSWASTVAPVFRIVEISALVLTACLVLPFLGGKQEDTADHQPRGCGGCGGCGH